MKNKVICYHPTLENDTKQFEDIVYNILKDSMDKEDLATLFNFSVISRLERIISILKQLL